MRNLINQIHNTVTHITRIGTSYGVIQLHNIKYNIYIYTPQ